MVDSIHGRTIIEGGFHIPLNPELASKIGLNEAIFIQQLHYWLTSKSAKLKDNHKWIYNTYKDWEEQFPFWSNATIRRAINSCEKKNLIITTSKYNKAGYDNTKWYSINYNEINLLSTGLPKVGKGLAQNEQRDEPERASGVAQNEQTNTIYYPETTTKNKEQDIKADALPTFSLYNLKIIDEVIHDTKISEVINRYANEYEDFYRKKHPNLKENQLKRIADLMESLEFEHPVDWNEVIKEFFMSDNTGNGNINYLFSGDEHQGVAAALLKNMY